MTYLLSFQIQMLLQAQQTSQAVPSSVMTPPSTPQSTNHKATASVNHPPATPTSTQSTNHNETSAPCTNQKSSSNQSPTRASDNSTSPQRSVTCSVGVNTGKSLVWPAAALGSNLGKSFPTRQQRYAYYRDASGQF